MADSRELQHIRQATRDFDKRRGRKPGNSFKDYHKRYAQAATRKKELKESANAVH